MFDLEYINNKRILTFLSSLKPTEQMTLYSSLIKQNDEDGKTIVSIILKAINHSPEDNPIKANVVDTPLKNNCPNIKVVLPTPHKAQQEILNDTSKYQIVNAGRRFGKDVLVLNKIVNAVLNSKDVILISNHSLNKNLQKALMDLNFIPMLEDFNKGILKYVYQTGGSITFLCDINLDTIEKFKCELLLVNEYDYVKKLDLFLMNNIEANEQFFIGTADGYSLFYAVDSDVWSKHSYSTLDNPHLGKEVLEALLTNDEIPAEILEREYNIKRK